MSYVNDSLAPGETVFYRARVRMLAYGSAIVVFLIVMSPHMLTGLASTELALTDRRVLGRVGMFRRRYLALKYAHIELVTSHQGVMGKLFNYGSVTVVGKEGTRVKFRGIADPKHIERQIEEAVEMAVLGRKISAGADENRLPLPAPARPILQAKEPPAPMPLPLQEKSPRAPVPKAYKDPDIW